MTTELSLDELKALRGQLHEKLNGHPYTKELDEVIANKNSKWVLTLRLSPSKEWTVRKSS